MSRVLHACVVALAFAAIASSPSAAQTLAEPGLSPGHTQTTGPTIAGAAVGVRGNMARPATSSEATSELTATAPRSGRGLRQSQVLMIVGGAALVSGILIGGPAGTLLVLGGAAIGGYGVYLHLQR